jgi:hypothetical protein
MDERQEDDENGPDTDSDGKGKAHTAGAHAGAHGVRGGGSHSFVPSTLRGPRASASRSKIKETLTDHIFDGDIVENHYNRK